MNAKEHSQRVLKFKVIENSIIESRMDAGVTSSYWKRLPFHRQRDSRELEWVSPSTKILTHLSDPLI